MLHANEFFVVSRQIKRHVRFCVYLCFLPAGFPDLIWLTHQCDSIRSNAYWLWQTQLPQKPEPKDQTCWDCCLASPAAPAPSRGQTEVIRYVTSSSSQIQKKHSGIILLFYYSFKIMVRFSSSGLFKSSRWIFVETESRQSPKKKICKTLRNNWRPKTGDKFLNDKKNWLLEWKMWINKSGLRCFSVFRSMFKHFTSFFQNQQNICLASVKILLLGNIKTFKSGANRCFTYRS